MAVIETRSSLNRLSSIDGLRGLAAIFVVFFHFYGALIEELDRALPDAITIAFSYGYLGVPVFFVISGFVIALSVGDRKVNKSYLGNFALRRSVRLDFTYWASIILALCLIQLKNLYLGSNDPLPGASDLALHLLYLQDIVGVDEDISVVYWTLCLEVQLYIFYITSLWGTQRLVGVERSYYVHLLGVTALGLYSIMLDLNVLKFPFEGLFVSNWHYFLMGIMVCNVVRQKPYSTLILCSWLMIEILAQYLIIFKEYAIAGTACTFFIFLLWKLNAMERVFSSRILQYLGTLSYTIYLIHPDLGGKVIALGRELLGGELSGFSSVALFCIAVAVSVIVAHALHVFVEKPSLRLSSRLKKERLRDIVRLKFHRLHRRFEG